MYGTQNPMDDFSMDVRYFNRTCPVKKVGYIIRIVINGVVNPINGRK